MFIWSFIYRKCRESYFSGSSYHMPLSFTKKCKNVVCFKAQRLFADILILTFCSRNWNFQKIFFFLCFNGRKVNLKTKTPMCQFKIKEYILFHCLKLAHLFCFNKNTSKLTRKQNCYDL